MADALVPLRFKSVQIVGKGGKTVYTLFATPDAKIKDLRELANSDAVDVLRGPSVTDATLLHSIQHAETTLNILSSLVEKKRGGDSSKVWMRKHSRPIVSDAKQPYDPKSSKAGDPLAEWLFRLLEERCVVERDPPEPPGCWCMAVNDTHHRIELNITGSGILVGGKLQKPKAKVPLSPSQSAQIASAIDAVLKAATGEFVHCGEYDADDAIAELSDGEAPREGHVRLVSLALCVVPTEGSTISTASDRVRAGDAGDAGAAARAKTTGYKKVL